MSSHFDIGEFLNSYDSLKGEVNELSEILQMTNMLRRWDVPSLSFLCCVFVMTLCISFPEFLFVFCLSPIPLVLLVTYVKTLGDSKQIRHIVVMAVKNEEECLKRKHEVAERSRKDLRRFIKVLCEMQGYIDVIYGKVTVVKSLFLWKDPQLTIRFLGSVFVLMLLLTFVPVSLLFLASFLYFILNNREFRKVVCENLPVFLPIVKIQKNSKAEVEDDDSSVWEDACSGESDESSFEDEISSCSEDSMGENNVDHNAEKRSKSLASHISEYRRRRQELMKGNCAACDVAFSSLLARRRYCRRCGDKFCSKCCRHYVKKGVLGVTAPGSREDRVLVCNDCYGKLRLTKAPD